MTVKIIHVERGTARVAVLFLNQLRIQGKYQIINNINGHQAQKT